MERWDGAVLDVNATCIDLGQNVCSCLACMPLVGVTTSYPYGKGKISALNMLLAGDVPGLADVLGEVGTLLADLMESAKPFFIVLYGQLPGTSMESSHFTLFTKKKKSRVINQGNMLLLFSHWQMSKMLYGYPFLYMNKPKYHLVEVFIHCSPNL